MKINICNIPYEVRYVDDSFNQDTQFGEIKYLEGVIRINKNITDELKQRTLWHEAVHGVLELIGRGDLSDDEVLVSNLATALDGCAELKCIAEGREDVKG